ncbi:MAG: hypothetical protein ACT6Q8_05790 [Niveispirillum sp.]|uniref:hypothetical protein n=1 Tax=Niveispirillum sp. TaxID=1917217 RepID=UPI00403746ED
MPLIIGVILFGRFLPEARELGEQLLSDIGDRLPELTAALAILPDGHRMGGWKRCCKRWTRHCGRWALSTPPPPP